MIDIAREAGVSKTTVSRVLNDSPKVTDETRKRIVAAMSKLDFRVNQAARTLRTSRTALVGLFVPTIEHEVFSQIAQGFDLALSEHDIGLVISTSNWNRDLEIKALRRLAARGVDAVALALVDDRYRPTAEFLRSFDRPIVLLDREVAGLAADAILTEQRVAMMDVVAHLRELGHERIGLLRTSSRARPGRESTRSYRRACIGQGLEPFETIVAHVSYEAGAAGIDKILERDATAVIFCIPTRALAGALHRLDDLGLTYPEDISLVTYDETELASAKRPRLTVLSRPLDRITKTASEMIMSRLAEPDQPPRVETIMTHLEVRDSTGQVPRRGARRL